MVVCVNLTKGRPTDTSQFIPQYNLEMYLLWSCDVENPMGRSALQPVLPDWAKNRAQTGNSAPHRST